MTDLDPADADDILWLAEYLHDKYEHIARRVGWETQDGTSVPFEDLPDENKEVMIRLASALLTGFNVEVDAEYLRMDYQEEFDDEH